MKPESERSIGIDCLRGIAIIWVLLYHFVPLPIFNRGTFGVLLFFIISGYCIYFSVDSSASAWRFYAKRIGRLLPALVVCAFATTLFKHLAPQLIDANRNLTWLDLAKSLLSLPILNAWQANYTLPDGAYWSLVVEFQFYFFCALALLAGLRDRLIYLLCIVIAFRTLTTSTDYYTTNDFFPFFLAGMGVASVMRGKRKEGVIGIGVAFFFELYHLKFNFKQPSVPIEMYRSLLLVCATAAVYAAARFEPGRSAAALRPLAFVGLISYPLYLIHQDVGNMLLHGANIGRDSVSDLLIRAIAIPSLLGVVAWLIYRVVERPAIKPLTAFLTDPLRMRSPDKI